jgi:Asp-tRNA(Asn)/Glu-tRNA(Gln) amidotransferase A subunit family amidase
MRCVRDQQSLSRAMTPACWSRQSTGTPVAATPAGRDAAGVPFGITLLAGLGQDRRLLGIAAAVEAAIGERVVPEI